MFLPPCFKYHDWWVPHLQICLFYRDIIAEGALRIIVPGNFAVTCIVFEKGSSRSYHPLRLLPLKLAYSLPRSEHNICGTLMKQYLFSGIDSMLAFISVSPASAPRHLSIIIRNLSKEMRFRLPPRCYYVKVERTAPRYPSAHFVQLWKPVSDRAYRLWIDFLFGGTGAQPWV